MVVVEAKRVLAVKDAGRFGGDGAVAAEETERQIPDARGLGFAIPFESVRVAELAEATWELGGPDGDGCWGGERKRADLFADFRRHG